MYPEREEHIQHVPTESSLLCNTGLRMGRASNTERESERERAQKTDLDQEMVEIST